MKRIFTLLVLATAFLLPFGCNNDDNFTGSGERYQTHLTAEYNGQMAHEWMELGYQMIRDNFLFGPHAARTYGYLGLTVYESVYAGIPGAKSMSGQINDYQAVNIDKSKEYDWGIVLCSAMRTVMPELMDNISIAQRSQVTVLADLQENQMMANGISETVREDSKELGTLIGLSIVQRMDNDGRDIIRNIIPTVPQRNLSTTPWYYDVSANPNHPPVEPLWGTVRTFVIDNSQSCQIDPPFPYSTEPGSDFRREAEEVYNVDRSQANRSIAYHWENGPGRTCSPACHWVSITQQLLKSSNRKLDGCAKAYALVGFAAADGFSVTWYHKYVYYLLRPVTYIHEVMDPNWQPLVGTPPYPDYTSGSSTIGGAAPVVLTEIFGDIPFTDRTHLGSALYTPENPFPAAPYILPERTFPSLIKAGEEQALSRILGGVHFRRACDLGLVSGRCVGTTILNRLDFGF